MGIYGGMGLAESVKVPAFDKIADLGLFSGAVDPLKVFSQYNSIPFSDQCSKSFNLTPGC